MGRPGTYGHEHPTRHLLSQQHRKGVRSQTKEYTPCKDLDTATKRLLSTRLVKINELKNALVELQQQHDNIQLENRTLRQVTASSVFTNTSPSTCRHFLNGFFNFYVKCTFIPSCRHYKGRIDSPYPIAGSGTSAAPQRHRQPVSPANVAPFQRDPRVPRAAPALSRASSSIGAKAEGQGGAATEGAVTAEKESGVHHAAEAFARPGRPGDQRRAESKAGERKKSRPSGRRENQGELVMDEKKIKHCLLKFELFGPA